MIFKKKDRIEKHAKNLDKLVTGMIIGGAIASILGVSRRRKVKGIPQDVTNRCAGLFQRGYKIFGKILVGLLKLITPKK